MMNAIGFALCLVQLTSEFSIRGVVRWSDTERPIAGALVEVVGSDHRTWSDADGAYAISGLTCVSCEFRFSAPLTDTAIVEVNVGADSVVHVDVVLVPRPGRLREIAVVGRLPHNTASSVVGLTADSEPADVGTRRYTAADMEASPMGSSPDPLRILTGTADVAWLPDVGTSLHVRGGSADQNLVLLDGIPLYSPYHASGVLSAVSPDFVDAVTLDAGVPSASYGNALSSTIAIATRRPTDAIVVHGGTDALAVRQSVAGPLPGGVGDFVLAARQSTRSLAFRHIDRAGSGGFGDAAAKFTVGLPLGSLELLAFGTRDHISFDGQVLVDTAAGGQNFTGTTGTGLPTPRNAFSWSNATQAAVWSLTADRGPRITVRGWHSQTDAQIAWAAASGAIGLVSSLQDFGAGGEATWTIKNGQLSTGAGVERFATNYQGTGRATASAPGSPSGPYLHLQASPLLAFGFIEGRWRLGQRWSLMTGVREEAVPGVGSTLEPRVSVRYALTPTLTATGGFARTQQVLQSLRNEESILDAVVGVGLPVASGTTGVPVARADQFTGALEQRFGEHTRLTLGGYVRRLDGILAIGSVTAQPFALDRVRAGTGTASGLGLEVQHRGERLGVQAAYGLNVAARAAGSQRYVPSFDARHTVTAAVGYRVGSATTVRGALWAASERPTSLIGDAFEWTPYAPVGGAGELAGSPQQLIGPFNGRRLPPYVRVDLGVTQVWRPKVFGRVTTLTGRLGLTNALNHANILGTLLPPGTTAVQRLPLLPRSLVFGIEWTF